MDAGDAIIIRGLDLPVHLGVPEAERSVLQNVTADVRLVLRGRFDQMGDEIARTVNYETVAGDVRALAAARPRKLLETLATEIANSLLQTWAMVASVEVELRKRILPGVDHVAVRLVRSRS